ncbi:SH3 domain-containing protein [Cellvibrio sp. ARAG 10.3]|uniref:SH3 domain-containing protein n=1 Tax=Cellvibrio sp. ARAG 10.3 TaxID=3451358 RepID=UPI003F4800F3
MINAVSLPLGDVCFVLHRRCLRGIGGLLFLCAALWLSPGAWADDDPQVTVNDAYINVHNGPGRGYPIFHVVERGEVITLLKSRTDWIKIKTYRGKTGWVRRRDLQFTLGPDGQPPELDDPKQEDYLTDRFELGVALGDFNGADSLTGTLGYRFTENLTAELRVAQNTGQFSDSQILAVALLHQPFPEWRISPFFSLGTGEIKTLPSATLVEPEDRNDTLIQASLGSYIHLTGRFFMRVEYTNHMILTSRNDNEEVNEWKVGFNIFF